MTEKERSFEMGKRLKQLRDERNLSHVALKAELEKRYDIKISRNSLMNYEIRDDFHSKSDKFSNLHMGADYLSYLADFYDVSADYLLGRSNIRSANPDIQAAVRYTGLSEKTIKSLRQAKKEFVLLNEGFSTDSEIYHFKNDPADLFFSSPNFKKAIFAFHKYGAMALLHEHTYTQFIKTLQNMGLIPQEKTTITPEEIFNIASEQENDEDMQTVFGLGETLLTIQDKAEYCKYCLIKELGKIADSYKDSIVDYIEKVGDGNG